MLSIRLPRKKGTDDTFVNSPLTPSSPGPGDIILEMSRRPTGKRSVCSWMAGFPANMDISKGKKHSRTRSWYSWRSRRDSESTVVGDVTEVKKDDQYPDNLKNGAILEEEELQVSSPVSESEFSSLASDPSSPSSLASELYPTTSLTFSDNASTQAALAQLHPRKRDSEGAREKRETVRSVAILVARTVVNVAEASNVPYVKGVAGLVALIFEYTDGASENKEDCERIRNRVEDIVNLIKQCASDPDADRSLKDDLEALTIRLERVVQSLEKLYRRGRSYFQRFICQEEDRQIIQRAEKDLEHAYIFFHVQSQLKTRSAIAGFDVRQKVLREEIKDMVTEAANTIRSEVKAATSRANPQMITEGLLVEEPEEISDLNANCNVVPPQRSLRTPLDRAAASASLPPAHKIFYGRDNDLKELVDTVTSNSAAHVAILGPGGIGKSTLALALLNHKDIVDKFKQYRFFVRCDAANSAEGLVSAVVTHLGLSNLKSDGWREAIKGAKKVLSGATSDDESQTDPLFPGPSCILVLDNFETPWEPPASKRDVEELLSFLAEVEGLTLILTLRGAERPAGVEWTKPFLPALQTLDSISARRMFIAISDADFPESTEEDSRDTLDELLDLYGYLPLAVGLAAHLAQPGLETVPNLIKRWKEESPRMLSNGEDRRDNLEVSVELSLSSPRVQQKPKARVLLSALSLLPDGLNKNELRLAIPTLSDVGDSTIVLQKTSLAYVDDRNRIKVLAPIRAYMSSTYPPSKDVLGGLEEYLWGLIKAANCLEDKRKADAIRHAVQELGNIESLVIWALKEFDPVPAIQAIIDLGRFYNQANVGKPPLLDEAINLSQRVGNKQLEADCISIKVANDIFINYGTQESIDSDIKRAMKLYEEIGDKRGLANCMERLARHYHNRRRFQECEATLTMSLKMYEEVGERSGQTSALLCLSRCYRIMSKPELCLDFAQRALTLARADGDDLYLPIKEAQALQQMGDVFHVFYSDYTKAKDSFDKALIIHEDLGLEESSHFAALLSSMGEVYNICSDYERAREFLEHSRTLFLRLGVNDRAAYALNRLASAFLGLSQTRMAAEAIEKSSDLWEKANNEWGRGITIIAKGDLALARRELAEAERHYEQARLKVNADSDMWKAVEAECLFKLGMVKKDTEQREEALDYTRRALAAYRIAKQKVDEMMCIRQIAELTLSNPTITSSDEQELALSHLRHARQCYDDMGLEKEKGECDGLLAAAEAHNRSSNSSQR